MTEQSELSEFGEQLAHVQTDSQLNWAAVKDAEPMRRENARSDVEPGDSDAGDDGLLITFELASGRELDLWYRKPTEWDIVAENLVLLLEYWDLDPGDLDKLAGEEELHEIPVEHDESVGDFRPDWQRIVQTIQTRQLEAKDD